MVMKQMDLTAVVHILYIGNILQVVADNNVKYMPLQHNKRPECRTDTSDLSAPVSGLCFIPCYFKVICNY